MKSPPFHDQKNKLATAREKYGKAKKVLLDADLDDREKALMDKLDESIKVASPLVNKVVELGTQNKNADATALMMSESGPATRRAIAVIDEIVNYERDLSRNLSRKPRPNTSAHAR
jgi:methyl-accepting chemotaxis protein